MFGSPHTFDDRDKPVVYRDPMFSGGSQLDPKTQQRVNRDPNFKRVRIARWGVVLVLLTQVVTLLTSTQSVSSVVWRVSICVLGAGIVFYWVLPPVRRAMWSAFWKDRYKEVGRCPACQYDLRGLEAAPDGCTVCPECGGAWRLPPSVVSKSS